MNYTIKHLQYFVAACEAESVKKAAERLNISQPSVSAAIAHLEGVFGVQLFIRHHAKGLSLTSSGRRLLGRANQLLKHAESLHQYASDLAGSLSGVLDVACFLTLAPVIMPNLIRGFQKNFPRLVVHCHEGDHGKLYRGLLKGDFEIALVYDMGPHSETEFVPILELPPYVILPPRHRLAGEDWVALEDLAEEPLVLLDLPHSRDYFMRLFYRQNLEPNIVYRTTSPDMVRGLVANGLGYALMNARIGLDRALDGRKFAAVGLSGGFEPLRMGVVRITSLGLTRAASTFMDYCQHQLPKSAV